MGTGTRTIYLREYTNSLHAHCESKFVERIANTTSVKGYLARSTIEAMLEERGTVRTLALDYKRYVGAQIGIHNLKGEKVGKVSHTRNKELLFIVDSDPQKAVQAAHAAEAVI